MWIIFSLLSITAITLDTLFAKKRINVSDGNQFSVMFYSNFANIVYTIAIYSLGLSESGLSPIAIIIKYPFAFICALSMFLYGLFVILALQYLFVTKVAPFFNLSPVISFVALFMIFRLTGTNLGTAGEFSLVRIAAISLIFLAIFVVFRIEKREAESDVSSNTTTLKKYLVLGYIFLTLSVLADSLNTISSSYLFAVNGLGGNDVMAVYGVTSTIICTVLFIYFGIKHKNPFRLFDVHKEKDAMLSGAFSMTSTLFFAYAQNLSPIFAPILIYTSSIFEILVGIFFFKEKVSKDHLVALGVVILAIFLFSIGEFM